MVKKAAPNKLTELMNGSRRTLKLGMVITFIATSYSLVAAYVWESIGVNWLVGMLIYFGILLGIVSAAIYALAYAVNHISNSK